MPNLVPVDHDPFAADVGPPAATGGQPLVPVEHDPFAPEKPKSSMELAKSLGWLDVPSQALSNAPASAKKLATDVVQPFLHPVETLSALKNVGLGAYEKATGGGEHEQYADALWQAVKDRYGSVENLKRTLATDPVGALADLSLVGTGGAGALARAPGVVGKIGQAAGTVARAIDPVSGAITATKAAVGGTGKLASELIGMTTGTGGESVRQAARAGMEGGESSRAFSENMRGNVPTSDVVSEAQGAVRELRNQRAAEYRAGTAPVRADTTPLNFTPIENAVSAAFQVKRFKGVSISPSTSGVQSDIGELVQKWKALPAADYHTAEGLDALKQSVGDIRDATEYGSPSRKVADQVYQNIRGQIVKQVPEYAPVMRAYERASAQIKEIERTLSLNPGANVDTALRKLQSTLRNNVNANFGRRAELAHVLEGAGAPNLMSAIAGQTMNTWTPRGLVPKIAAVGGQVAAGATANPAFLATLPISSPRLVGEAAHLAGQAARYPALGTVTVAPYVEPAGRSLIQLGRVPVEY